MSKAQVIFTQIDKHQLIFLFLGEVYLSDAFVSPRVGGLWKPSLFSATHRIERSTALFAEIAGNSQDDALTTLSRNDDTDVVLSADAAVVGGITEAEETNPAFQPRDSWSKADFFKSEWKIAVQWNNKDTFEETWIRFYDEVSLLFIFQPFLCIVLESAIYVHSTLPNPLKPKLNSQFL